MCVFLACASHFARLCINEIHFCLYRFCYHDLHGVTIANSLSVSFLSFFRWFTFDGFCCCCFQKRVLCNLRRVGCKVSNIFILSNQWGHKDLFTLWYLMISFIYCCRRLYVRMCDGFFLLLLNGIKSHKTNNITTHSEQCRRFAAIMCHRWLLLQLFKNVYQIISIQFFFIHQPSHSIFTALCIAGIGCVID